MEATVLWKWLVFVFLVACTNSLCPYTGAEVTTLPLLPQTPVLTKSLEFNANQTLKQEGHMKELVGWL